MKQVLLYIFLIVCSAFANISKGQAVDTNRVNSVGLDIFEAFKKESIKDYERLLMSKSDYKTLIRKTKWELFPKEAFKDGYNYTMQKAERQFQNIIRKGEYQNISWSEIEFDQFVFHSEETQLINKIEPEPVGFLVSGHLVFQVNGTYYTIIGIELLKCGNTYKIFGFPEGVYPVRLEQYIATDSIDFRKNGTD